MPIGEFGGGPAATNEGAPALTTPLYWLTLGLLQWMGRI